MQRNLARRAARGTGAALALAGAVLLGVATAPGQAEPAAPAAHVQLASHAASHGRMIVLNHQHQDAQRSCTIGPVGYSTYYGPPGQVTVWWDDYSHPIGCECARSEVFWHDAGGDHHAYSAWTCNPGNQETAKTNGPVADGYRLEREPHGSTGENRQCKKVPGAHRWRGCTG